MSKKLTRSSDDKWLAGVCGGLAEYTGIDANLVRLVVAVTTVLGAGSVAIAYLVAWAIMPKPAPSTWSGYPPAA
ncbi:PspC domain-containing protein [Aeromicrobium massiliense]|uniref:PspC domain-containing protein n=1 Tax=Aeromicrobium massiliense TaxID=1464554 RepID=UPI0005788265|nr:PspC domain-containing protein [Aeromicrobium massiliense]